MGNLVEIEKFHSDELSDTANDFINNNRCRWNNFIVQVQVAVKEGDQDKLDTAIGRLAPYLEKEGGKPLWDELWSWVIRTNRNRWKKLQK